MPKSLQLAFAAAETALTTTRRMHTRESIPNVGRRAHGRGKKASLLMMKGNGVSSSKPPLPPTQDPMEVRRSSLARGTFLDGRAGNLDNFVMDQPDHPYNRIIQRILHRHREASKQQSRGDAADGSSPRHQGGARAGRRDHYAATIRNGIKAISSEHLNHPLHLKHYLLREEDSNSRERDFRWQGAATDRVIHGRAEETPQRRRRKRRSKSREHSLSSSSDLTGNLGSFTDRDQGVWVVGDRLETTDLDTTRSEPAAGLGLCSHRRHCQSHEDLRVRESGAGAAGFRLPNLSKQREPGPLDELLDYFWVYQGMGRQVLDMDTPHRRWEDSDDGDDDSAGRDTKSFHQPLKLPPMNPRDNGRGALTEATSAISPSEKKADLTPSEKSGRKGRSLVSSDRRRAISEPRCVTKCHMTITGSLPLLVKDPALQDSEHVPVVRQKYCVPETRFDILGVGTRTTDITIKTSKALEARRKNSDGNSQSSCIKTKSLGVGANALDASVKNSDVSAYTSNTLDSHPRRDGPLEGSYGKKKQLVIKMPVLSQELSCVSLFECD